MIERDNNEYVGFFRFLCLAGWELLLAGLMTVGISWLQGGSTSIILLAVGITIAGAVLLAGPPFLRKNGGTLSKLALFLYNKSGLFVFLAVPLVLYLFLFFRDPDLKALQSFGFLITALWLIGLEALFFFQKKIAQNPSKKNSPLNRWVLISLLFAYGILLIPSKIPTLLDGIPWNTPLEFIFAVLLLPLAFFTGQAFLGKRTIAFLLSLLFVAKLLLVLFAPQSGLGIRAYTSKASLDSGKWQRGYESILWPSYTQIAQSPYQSFREFPVEWINYHAFEKDNFWLALELHGAVALQENERLVFIIQGAQNPQIMLSDSQAQTNTPAVIISPTHNLDSQLYKESSYVRKAEINGTLIFPKYGQFRFEPLIIRSDGSVRLASSSIWLSPTALDSNLIGLQFGLNGIELVFMVLMLLGFLVGTVSLYSSGRLNSIDLYLAETGLILYFFADVADKPGINSAFIFITAILAIVKLLDLTIHSRGYSWIGYFFAVGIPVLLMFLALDINQLSRVDILPPYQDAMEYQMLARNIYVSGDVFLLKTPPWSYKVLFPYIIGLLHLVFGQSMSGQLFLNAWCAILSILFIAELSIYFGLSKRIAFVTSVLFLLLLLLPVSFIFYFRFGLIEPVAILTLLAAGYFAKERKYLAMFIIGIVTGMLRLNLAGAIFSAVLFLSPRIVGEWRIAWKNLLNWCWVNWKRIIAYLLFIPMPSLLITYFYSLYIPAYTLSPSWNQQTSLRTVLESLMIVIIGGDGEFLNTRLRSDPAGVILTSLPIVVGLMIAFMSLVYRRRFWSAIDLRLGLFLISMLPIYAVLRPIAYFPRYSWSFLPPAMILIMLLFQSLFRRDNTETQIIQEDK